MEKFRKSNGTYPLNFLIYGDDKTRHYSIYSDSCSNNNNYYSGLSLIRTILNSRFVIHYRTLSAFNKCDHDCLGNSANKQCVSGFNLRRICNVHGNKARRRCERRFVTSIKKQ